MKRKWLFAAFPVVLMLIVAVFLVPSPLLAAPVAALQFYMATIAVALGLHASHLIMVTFAESWIDRRVEQSDAVDTTPEGFGYRNYGESGEKKS